MVIMSNRILDQQLARAQSNVDTDTCTGAQEHSRQTRLRWKWKELKEESERRKAERLQTVSAMEADRITGLDRHREEEAKKSTEYRRGGKSVVGALFLPSLLSLIALLLLLLYLVSRNSYIINAIR